MYITSSILGAALAVLATKATAAAGSVLDLTPTNFDSEIGKGVPALVEFFAPWCGHCKNLAPVYEELAASFASASPSKVKIAKVDADAHKDLGKKYDVSGFPTLKWFDGSGGTPEDYKGGRALEDLQDFVQEKTGVKPKRAPKPISYIRHLTDRDFNNVVGKDKDVFVAFTAPWCGHCKTLAPTWEKLAATMEPDNDKIIVAKVDAEANPKTAEAHGVASYPTIKYFAKNKPFEEAWDFRGSREEEDLVNHVNLYAGTHRVAGGGLDLTAGTIETLDKIVARVNQAGEDLAALTTEAKKSAVEFQKNVKDKSADYYIRVLDKLSQNAGYLEKESGRLEGLLKKGGLARAKEDDLQRRLNVLKRFAVGSDGDSKKDEL